MATTTRAWWSTSVLPTQCDVARCVVELGANDTITINGTTLFDAVGCVASLQTLLRPSAYAVRFHPSRRSTLIRMHSDDDSAVRSAARAAPTSVLPVSS